MERHVLFMNRRHDFIHLSIFPKLIYEFNASPRIFVGHDKTIMTFI